MSRCLVMSDLHLGHKNICKFRPIFSTVTEHDETIMSNIVDTVSKRDVLWILGDCFFTEKAYCEFFKNVKCETIHWIVGNHDTDKPERQELVKRFCRETNSMFGNVGSLYKRGKFWLSHHPIHPMELRGKRNIHGHTHEVLMETPEGEIDDRYINVCCEHVNYRPVQMTRTEVNI